MMRSVSSKLAYLHGLAEGLGLELQEGDPARLLRGILDVLDTMTDELEEVTALSADLEEAILDMRRADDLVADELLEVVCDRCGETVLIDPEALSDASVVLTCPNCDRELGRDNVPDKKRSHGKTKKAALESRQHHRYRQSPN